MQKCYIKIPLNKLPAQVFYMKNQTDMAGQNNNPSENTAGKGIDNWNQRLDRNLEPEKHGDELADLRAEDFSNQQGSGDQSDELFYVAGDRVPSGVSLSSVTQQQAIDTLRHLAETGEVVWSVA